MGQATVTATPWDIGNPAALFDGNYASLYRTANINPAIVTLSFAQPQTVNSIQTLYGNSTSWQVETADSLADLDSQTGTYRIAVPPTNIAVDTLSVASVSPPVTANYFRLTAQRTSGDNYVHIYEWALIGDIVPDVAEPVAMLSNSPTAVLGGASSSFEVRYQDDIARRRADDQFRRRDGYRTEWLRTDSCLLRRGCEFQWKHAGCDLFCLASRWGMGFYR